mgnify:CR=1 FL=1
MNKFIRAEDTILNTNNIEAAYINYRTIKYVDGRCDEKVEYGIMVVMTNNPQPYVFTSISLDEFMGLLNGY